MFTIRDNDHYLDKAHHTNSIEFDNVEEILHKHLTVSQLEFLQELADLGASSKKDSQSRALFFKRITVKFRHPDLTTDVCRSVILRVSSHPSNDRATHDISTDETQPPWSIHQGFSERMVNRTFETLLIEIYDDEDPFTLLQYRLSPHTFSQLKHEQRLLVDFQGFPGMLIQLLERCNTVSDIPVAGSRGAHGTTWDHPHSAPLVPTTDSQRSSKSAPMPSSMLTPPYSSEKALVALLICEISSCEPPPSPSSGFNAPRPFRKPVSVTLSVVERNNFRELTHLFLHFHPAPPDVALHHLAERIGHIKAYTVTLEQHLNKVETLYRETFMEYKCTEKRVAELLQQITDNHSSLTRKHQDEIQAMENETLKTLQEKEEVLTLRFKSKEEKLLAQIDNLERGNVNLKYEVKTLQEQMSQLTLTEQTAQKEKMTLTETVARLTEDLSNETTKNATLTRATRELETECRSLCSRLAGDQGDFVVMKEKLNRADEQESALNALRERESELCLALHTSAAQISKGNKLIESLQQALRRERAKNKTIKASNHQDYVEKTTMEDTLSAALQRENELIQRETLLLKDVKLLRIQLDDARRTNELQSLKIDALEVELTQKTVQNVLGSYSSDPLDTSQMFLDPISKFPPPPSIPSCSFPKQVPTSCTVFSRLSQNKVGNSVMDVKEASAVKQEYSGTSHLHNTPCPVPKPVRFLFTEPRTMVCEGTRAVPQQPPEPTLLTRPTRGKSVDIPVLTSRSVDTNVSFGKNPPPEKESSSPESIDATCLSSMDDPALGYSTSTYDSTSIPHFGLGSTSSP